jgi:hypothetical protein
MHHAKGKSQFFARLTEHDGKLADCLERIEYLYKNRSKENVPCREIYFNSNFEANKAKRVAKKKPAPEAVPAPAEIADSWPWADSSTEAARASVQSTSASSSKVEPSPVPLFSTGWGSYDAWTDEANSADRDWLSHIQESGRVCKDNCFTTLSIGNLWNNCRMTRTQQSLAL